MEIKNTELILRCHGALMITYDKVDQIIGQHLLL